MGAILKIQLSAFSNRKILPSTENIAILMPKLKEIIGIELLPSVINSQKIDITTGEIENVPNLSFSSMDNYAQVICSENRVDCILNFSAENQDGIENKFDVTSSVLRFIMENSSVLANRLALNVTYLSDICKDKCAFDTQVMHVVPYYQDKTIKEWSSRTNALGNMVINNIDESLNVITDYTHAINTNNKEKRIMCHTDINTIAENKDFRFKYDAIDLFEGQAKDIFIEIKSDLEALVNNEG